MASKYRADLPDQKTLRKLFRFDPKTGRLFWKKRPRAMFSSALSSRQWNGRFAGQEAFTALKDGYRRGLLFRQSVFAHRVIWKLVTGVAADEIDHIDGNRLNNRWKNLRSVPSGFNQRNSSRRSDNTTGMTGVVRRGERWIAQIGLGGTTVHIGVFDTMRAAVFARKEAETTHGFHRNHGKKTV